MILKQATLVKFVMLPLSLNGVCVDFSAVTPDSHQSEIRIGPCIIIIYYRPQGTSGVMVRVALLSGLAAAQLRCYTSSWAVKCGWQAPGIGLVSATPPAGSEWGRSSQEEGQALAVERAR